MRPSWEVADVLRMYGDPYLRSRFVSPVQRKAVNMIRICRTEQLGGHLYKCDSCGYEHPAYNSCNNRNCPKCGIIAKERWIRARMKDLLPVGYFHAVFTLAHELNPLVLANKVVMFEIFFRSVSETLQAFAKDPRWKLEGRLGFTAVLHTWDQLLRDHFHIHCLIPGGVLSRDGKRWTPSHKSFLFDVKALSKTFRGKFIDHLREVYQKGELSFPGKLAAMTDKASFDRFIRSLYRKDWVVYMKKPFAGPKQVLEYLARYTHRVALTNDRIRWVKDGSVNFSYKKRLRNDRHLIRDKTLPAQEFIRRFLLHVLPDGFMKIRHFGFLANKCKKQSLAAIRASLGVHEHPVSKLSPEDLMLALARIDITQCPNCKTGTMKLAADIPKTKIPRDHDPPSCRNLKCA